MRVVLDTNIWISALAYSNESSVPREVLDRFLNGDFELVISLALIDEFVEICDRENVEKKVTRKYFELMRHSHTDKPPYVLCVESKNQIDVIAADPDDNRFLECAIAGEADFIVSGDKHLLNLRKYQNVVILSPRDFVGQLKEES